MADTKVVYNTRFVGRKPVDGPLNDFRLSEVVTSLQKAGAGKEEDTRCSLELGDKNLTVTFTKKDEGFESDTESAKSVENSAVAVAGDKAVSGVEEKIIKDHVFRFEAGVDESYSSQPGSGSGSDSETSDHNKSSSGSSSASSSPTAELSKYKFDHLDTYSISDVLICHTDKVHKTCVVWVIRKTAALEALVFECSSEDNARQLYKKFHEVSKRSKLERHRRRKSDGGSIVTRGSDFGGLGRAADLKLRSPAAAEAVTINNIDTSVIEKAVEKNHQKWNLVQHTDKNGVTHIEVESSQQQPPASHLVTGAASPGSQQPRSLVTFSPQFLARGRGALGGVGGVAPRPGKQQDRTKFAKELETILSGEVRRRGEADTRDTKPESARVPEPTAHGRAQESLSLRQRAPALLLRKLDEFEEKAQKIWARAEQEEENRKVWSKSSASVIGITSPAPPGPQLDQAAPTEKDRANQKTTASKEKHERVDNQKNQVVDKEKISASPAATSNHTSGAKSRHKDGGGQKKEGEATNRILVPTKTGKEPAKKLYPKESPPMFGGRFVALGPPGQLPLAQPHSLPLYPLQLPGGVAWGHTRSAPTLHLYKYFLFQHAPNIFSTFIIFFPRLLHHNLVFDSNGALLQIPCGDVAAGPDPARVEVPRLAPGPQRVETQRAWGTSWGPPRRGARRSWWSWGTSAGRGGRPQPEQGPRPRGHGAAQAARAEQEPRAAARAPRHRRALHGHRQPGARHVRAVAHVPGAGRRGAGQDVQGQGGGAAGGLAGLLPRACAAQVQPEEAEAGRGGHRGRGLEPERDQQRGAAERHTRQQESSFQQICDGADDGLRWNQPRIRILSYHFNIL